MPLPETLPRGARRSSNNKSRYEDSAADSMSVGNDDGMASYLLSVGGHSKNHSKRRSRSNTSSNISTNSSTDSTAVTVVTGTVGASSVAKHSVAATEVEDDETRCLYGTDDNYGYDENELRQQEEEDSSDFQDDDDDDDDDSDSDDSSSKSSGGGSSISYGDDGTVESLTELSTIIDPRKIAQQQQSQQLQGQHQPILDRLSPTPRQSAVSTTDQEPEIAMKPEPETQDSPTLPEERIEVWIDITENGSQKKDEKKKKDVRAVNRGRRKIPLIQFFNRSVRKNKSATTIDSKTNKDQKLETSKERDDDSNRESKLGNEVTPDMYELEEENSIVASECTVISEEDQDRSALIAAPMEEQEEKEESQGTLHQQQEGVDEKPKNIFEEDIDSARHLSDEEKATTTEEESSVDGNSWLLPISCCIAGATALPEQDEEMVLVRSTSTKEPLVEPMEPRSILKSHRETHGNVKEVGVNNDGEEVKVKSTIPSTLQTPVGPRVVPKPDATRQQEEQRRRILAMFDEESPPEQAEELNNKTDNDVNSYETPILTNKKKDRNQTFAKIESIFKWLPVLLTRQQNKPMTDDAGERNDEDNLGDTSIDDNEEAERSRLLNPPPGPTTLSISNTNGEADKDAEGLDAGRSKSRRSASPLSRKRSVSPFRRRSSKNKDLQSMVNSYKAERLANQISKHRSSERLGGRVSQEQLHGSLSHRRAIKQSRKKEKQRQKSTNPAIDQRPRETERNGYEEHQKSTGHWNDWGIFK